MFILSSYFLKHLLGKVNTNMKWTGWIPGNYSLQSNDVFAVRLYYLFVQNSMQFSWFCRDLYKRQLILRNVLNSKSHFKLSNETYVLTDREKYLITTETDIVPELILFTLFTPGIFQSSLLLLSQRFGHRFLWSSPRQLWVTWMEFRTKSFI